MTNKSIRYAIVGAGMGAETHAIELPQVKGAILEAVYGRNPEKAEAFRARYGARKAYSDWDKMLADPEIDAVIIVTPNGLHGKFAKSAARAGKHVIVEKPLEITTARAREVMDVCEANGVSLFVIYQMRYTQSAQEIKATIESGKLGKIILANVIDNEYRKREYYAGDYWRGTREFEGGGCLMTQTTHLLDLVQYLVGPVKEVYAKVTTAVHEIETEDLAVATLTFENGALGVVSSSTAAYPAQRHMLTITGTEGTVIMNGEYDEIVYSGIRGSEEVIDTPEGFSFGDNADPRGFPTLRHRTQLQEITDSLISGKGDTEYSDDFLQALRVTDAIYLSAAEGRAVQTSDFK